MPVTRTCPPSPPAFGWLLCPVHPLPTPTLGCIRTPFFWKVAECFLFLSGLLKTGRIPSRALVNATADFQKAQTLRASVHCHHPDAFGQPVPALGSAPSLDSSQGLLLPLMHTHHRQTLPNTSVVREKLPKPVGVDVGRRVSLPCTCPLTLMRGLPGCQIHCILSWPRCAFVS